MVDLIHLLNKQRLVCFGQTLDKRKRPDFDNYAVYWLQSAESLNEMLRKQQKNISIQGKNDARGYKNKK